MKTYVGRRDEHEHAVVTVVDEAGERPLPLRRDLRDHSLEYNWGYGGSGPAQLALAILADFLGDPVEAEAQHQDFKVHVIAHLPQREPWRLTEMQVAVALRAIAIERERE